MNDTPTRALLRLTVQSEGRRLDATVPSHVPLVEVMPGFARSLGVLDPTMTSGGYGLQLADGTLLDPALPAGEQSVRDGDVLTLARGSLLAVPRVYDDVVEAVIDATGEQQPWSPLDNARTALAVSLSFVALCGVLLAAGGRGQLLGIVIASAGTVLLLAVAAFTARLGQREAGAGLGIAGAVYAALAAYLAVPADLPIAGAPLAAAGLAAVVFGGLALAISPDRPAVQFIPVVTGASVLVPATIAWADPAATTAAYTMMLAVAGALANSMPWLALSTTRLRVISPQTDAEVFADPGPIDAASVRARAIAGQRTLTALRSALGASMLIATPFVATASPWGALLCVLAFTGLMFPARMSFARAHVLVLLAIGAVGITLSVIMAALTQPDLAPAMLIGLAVTAGITIVITLLAPRARLALARFTDSAEVIVLALLLPVGLIAAGLF